MNANIFRSKDLELAYIQTAPPWELIRYFDLISQIDRGSPFDGQGYSITNENRFVWLPQMENAAFARNEPNIDIALAGLSSSSMIEALLRRHFDSAPRKPYELEARERISSETDWEHHKKIPEEFKNVNTYYERIILSALTNKYAMSWKYKDMENWLKNTWTWLIEYGKDSHFAALFSNPSCPRVIIDNILDGFECVYKPRYIDIVSRGLSAKILSKPPDNRYGPDLETYDTIQLFWRFLSKIDPSDFWIVREVALNVDNFPALKVKFREYGIVDDGDPGYDKFDSLLQFMTLLFNRFKSTAAEKMEYPTAHVWKSNMIEALINKLTREFGDERKVIDFIAAHTSID